MKKKFVPIALLVMAVIAVMELKKHKARSAPDACPDGLCTLPIPESKLIPERLQQAAASNQVATTEQPLPKLLDLGATKCVPCKAMAPVLDELKETFSGKMEVVFIDVWENEAAKAEYGVRMIPTQIFFDADGRELFRHVGFYSREEILSKWNELGYDFGEPQHVQQGMPNNEGRD